MQEYADIINFLASVCLLGISIQGKTGSALSVSDDITEPLVRGNNEKHSEVKRDNLYGKASLVQLVTFSWLNPLFEVGFKKPLDQDEVPDVDIKDSASFLSRGFDQCLKYTKETDGTEMPSIYKAVYIFGRKKAAINALFAVTSAATSYVGPYLINYFVEFLNEKKLRSLSSGYLLALGFLGAKLVETIAQRQWIFGARQLGLRLRAALISHIYKKGLILSSQSRRSRTSGEIINLMSVDVQRITDFIWYLNTVWMLPVQISLAIYVLHTNLGMGAFVALAATLTVMAGNIPLTRVQKRYQTKIMEAKDDRMNATSEVLRNMKTLKLQAWDSYYLQNLVNLRKTEHNWLWKSLRLSALSAFIFWGSPAFISVITFGGCLLMGIPLTAGRVLSALATFRMLQDPIFNLPDLLNVIAQGKVSVDRISTYQDADIYLLDDPFSAVDAHTGTQLFQNCLMGILKEKTILYVTHQVEFLPAADLILVCHKEHILTTVKGGALVPIIILAQSSFQVLQIASNYWMAWSCPTGSDVPTAQMDFVLFIYTLLAVGSAFCVLIRASLVAIAGLLTAEKLFSKMLNSVIHAPMTFFDSTPAGRILNRASTDQSVVDSEMATKLGWCAFSVIQLLGTIAVMSQVAWEVFVIFIPVTAICIWYQVSHCILLLVLTTEVPPSTARELARLAGIQRAPILHHFAESLSGAATIRAFDQQERFTDANLCLIDNHSRPWFHNVSAMEWLSFRLNQLSNFVFAFSLVLLVSLHKVMLSIAYHVPSSKHNLASEAPLVIEDSRPPPNCTFPGRKKVGVVGRTGSGKSTLIQAIFRIVEPREGSIIIDDVDISKIGLHDCPVTKTK